MWESLSRTITLVVTNCTKVAGLYVGIHEIVSHPNPNALVLAFSAFMMAGGQISETTVLAFIERFFGRK